MIATVFGGTLAADFAIFSAIIGMFGVIVKMLLDQKTLQKTAAESRKVEVKTVVQEVLNARPEMVNIQQPLHIIHEQQFVTKDEHTEHCGAMNSRVHVLERDMRMIRLKMDADKTEIISAGNVEAKDIHRRIDSIKNDIAAQPAQIISLLKNTKGVLG